MNNPRISKLKFTKENYGMDKGIAWPTCAMMDDTYEPLDGWEVIGYCKKPPYPSCTGGYRDYAVMFETFKTVKSGDIFDDDIEAGTKVWYHYDELPTFTKLKGATYYVALEGKDIEAQRTVKIRDGEVKCMRVAVNPSPDVG